MSANRKPRKKYRPRPVVNPLDYVISGLQPVSSTDKLGVLIPTHQAMVALKSGAASRHDWEAVAAALNVAAILAERGLGEPHREDIRAGQMAMALAGKRWIKWGKWQITPSEEEAISFAIAVHDAQLDKATVKDMELACREVNKRVRDPNKVMRAFHEEVGRHVQPEELAA